MLQFQTFRFSVMACRICLLAGLVWLSLGEARSACNPPFITGYTDYQTQSVTVNWVNLFGSDAWELEWVPEGESFSGIPQSGAVTNTFFVFGGLNNGSSYCFRIRSLCGGQPGEWSLPYCFHTSITPENDCSLDFDVQDPLVTQAFAESRFYYFDEAYSGKRLGEEVFIQAVELIVEHEWPSDLEILLRSPGGKQMILADQEGFNSRHYGIPGLPDCDSTALFSDEACLSVHDQAPLTGEFRPEQSFSSLYDGSALTGNWQLLIRDHNTGHQGILKYFRIHLSEQTCRLPDQFWLENTGPESILIHWEGSAQSGDSLILEYGPQGFVPGSAAKKTLPFSQGSFTIQGLQASTSYDIFVRTACDETFSVLSCPFGIETDCHGISLKESFDTRDLCEPDCVSGCLVSDRWFNAAFPANPWIVNAGNTATPDTGPESDPSGFGNYIYMESSENDCGFTQEAILGTDCLEFRANGDGCDFSFSYHMNGPDIGALLFQVSVDDGKEWETLFERSGDQGNAWHKATIDLSDYDGLIGRVRFVATGLQQQGADRGDIALDELVFYGSIPVIEAQYLFFPDSDGDNYGAETEPQFFCSNSLVAGFSRNDLDCDDTEAGINPGEDEIPCNSIDENCNGMDDDMNLVNPLLIDEIHLQAESCNGSMDASLALDISGGTQPYLFEWSTGSLDSVLTGIGAGVYTCRVLDVFGCVVITDSINVPAAEAMSIDQIETDIVSCNGARDGRISLVHSGGQAPYQYVWNNGETQRDLENLPPGNYVLTLTDANGCMLISPDIILTAATRFTVGLDELPPLCPGDSTGQIQIIGVQDGSPPFRYEWSTGSTDDRIEKLPAGYYHLTVTDADYCYSVIDSILVMDPEPLRVQVVAKDDVTCFGDNDGAIEIHALGGTAPYTFQWTRNGILFSTTDDLFQIRAGEYQLTLRDNNGCVLQTDTLVVRQPDQIRIELDTLVHADCIHSGDGSIQIDVEGGSGQYHYFWNGGGESGPFLGSLDPGLYQVVVTDRYGCKAIRNGIELDYLDIPIDLEWSILDSIFCQGDQTGRIEVYAPYADLPLDFNWSAGVKRIRNDHRDTLTNIGAGIFRVTLTDASGCVGTSESIQLVEPNALQYEVLAVHPLDCADDLSGEIQIEVDGGVKPYTYSWNNGRMTPSIQYLDGGYYLATITDANDCFLLMDSLFVFEPDPVMLTVSAMPASANQANGSATVLTFGGTTPYDYLWDEAAGNQTGQTATGLYAGEYWVTVTDFHQCQEQALVIVPLVDGVADTDPERIIAYPNPARDFIQLTGNFRETRMEQISLVDIHGLVWQYVYWEPTGPGQLRIHFSDVPPGYSRLVMQMPDKRMHIPVVVIP